MAHSGQDLVWFYLLVSQRPPVPPQGHVELTASNINLWLNGPHSDRAEKSFLATGSIGVNGEFKENWNHETRARLTYICTRTYGPMWLKGVRLMGTWWNSGIMKAGSEFYLGKLIIKSLIRQFIETSIDLNYSLMWLRPELLTSLKGIFSSVTPAAFSCFQLINSIL